jgi:hypothetical protein
MFLELNNQSTFPLLLLIPNNNNIDNHRPDTAVTDADESISLLCDTSTNEKGDDDDNNKNTGGDDGGARQKNSDSADIGLELDPDARKVLKDSYVVKWDEVHSNRGTSNKGGTQTDDKNNMAKIDTESDVDKESDAYIPETDELADDGNNADDNESEEGQVRPTDDEPHPQAKKKGGRKHNKMNVFENEFLEKLVDLTSYFASHDETDVPRRWYRAGQLASRAEKKIQQGEPQR